MKIITNTERDIEQKAIGPVPRQVKTDMAIQIQPKQKRSHRMTSCSMTTTWRWATRCCPRTRLARQSSEAEAPPQWRSPGMGWKPRVEVVPEAQQAPAETPPQRRSPRKVRKLAAEQDPAELQRKAWWPFRGKGGSLNGPAKQHKGES